MFFLKFLTFRSYQKSIIRTIENSYKSIILQFYYNTPLIGLNISQQHAYTDEIYQRIYQMAWWFCSTGAGHV